MRAAENDPELGAFDAPRAEPFFIGRAIGSSGEQGMHECMHAEGVGHRTMILGGDLPRVPTALRCL